MTMRRIVGLAACAVGVACMVSIIAGCSKKAPAGAAQSVTNAEAANAEAHAAEARANADACAENTAAARRELEAALESARPQGTPEEERRIAEAKYARAQERLRRVTAEGQAALANSQ